MGWDSVMRSIFKAAKILNIDITETEMPANWDELVRLKESMWNKVYAKRRKK